jgi:hypothetical protein
VGRARKQPCSPLGSSPTERRRVASHQIQWLAWSAAPTSRVSDFLREPARVIASVSPRNSSFTAAASGESDGRSGRAMDRVHDA